VGKTARVDGGLIEYIVPPLCDVPEGPFLMGDHTHSVTLPFYRIARFPVTVAEYACFVRTGQSEPHYWQNQQQLDHPVVFVLWNDAVGYAAWLSERTGHLWRLPSEEEWEKAARGTDGRVYPWGNTFDKTLCNTGESGIKGTTPIGKYPRGAGPYGTLDQAGNVWEWTTSLYDNTSDRRVLRGGSWDDGASWARAAYRGRLPKINIFTQLACGFRLVMATPAGS
jgi:formylglycine-generating enzyme required for sulfatase activity